jgi:hypothetical protein
MPQGRPRDSRKEQQWRRWLQLWQQSGLTVRAFCEQHGLSQPSFYAWRRRLHAPDTTFLPVDVVPEPPPRDAGHGFEIVWADGRRLRVPPRFEPAALRQLLAVLEEAWPC